MINERLIQGINSSDDIQTKNQDSFRFHGPLKALFYKLVKLINPCPDRWLDNTYGNATILAELYREYEGHEKQQWRRDVLTRVIPFGICLSAYDENYGEVVDWFLYRIIQEQGRFKFETYRTDPNCWFQDGRGRFAISEDVRHILIEKGLL